jgi:hypothetical protein
VQYLQGADENRGRRRSAQPRGDSMANKGALVTTVAVSALALLMSGAAFGQVQRKEQRKCINKLNKDTSKVAAKQGKANFGCVKAARKGIATSACLTLDPKSKVANAKTKTTDDESKHDCLATNAPNFGYTNASSGNSAAQNGEVDLFVDVYGTSDPTAVISSAKSTGKCQAAVTKGIEKVIAAKWKQYVSCKKQTLKGGAMAASALAACLDGDPNSVTADPKSKIAKTLAKLDNVITVKKCAAETVSTTFPGACSGASPASLAFCLDVRAECRLCLAINSIDGLSVDCDLFDDGMANSSCFILD